MTLVVVLDGGARGYLAGNYVASVVVLLASGGCCADGSGCRCAAAVPRSRPLLRFGVPTVPADATVFALNVVDRAYILRSQSAAAAGLFALSVKLATAVILAVRGFQLAWPPLAYSIADDGEARRFYAAVATWYVVVAGYVVAGLTLLGRWVVRLLSPPEYFAAHEALPWVALGWAMYGLFLVLVTIGGRAGVTTRTFPAALAGVIVNVVLLVLLVDPLGIAGAGIALVAAYAVMLVVLHLLTRGLFTVPFEWGRLAHAVVLLAGVAVAGELLLPARGVAGFAAARRRSRAASRSCSSSPASCARASSPVCAVRSCGDERDDRAVDRRGVLRQPGAGWLGRDPRRAHAPTERSPSSPSSPAARAATTNNRMELQAVISGLQSLERPTTLTVHIDSTYVMDAIVKRWHVGWKARGWKTAAKQPVKNQDLWETLLELVERHTIDWRKVKGHAGVELNERCDELAVLACRAARGARQGPDGAHGADARRARRRLRRHRHEPAVRAADRLHGARPRRQADRRPASTASSRSSSGRSRSSSRSST